LESLRLAASQRSDLEAATAMYETNLDLAADFLTARGLSRDQAIGLRLGVCVEPHTQDHARFVTMLSIPYLTPAGVMALKFRQLQPERKPKYDAPAGQHARLYNVAALHSKGDTVAVCEGELDAAVMTYVVGVPAVGIPGASHWLPYWSRCFQDYERVLVVADADIPKDGKEPPGQRHAERVVKEIGGSARLILPPAGEDLTSWVQRDGIAVVKEACGV